jgi:hypothetical protein
MVLAVLPMTATLNFMLHCSRTTTELLLHDLRKTAIQLPYNYHTTTA